MSGLIRRFSSFDLSSVSVKSFVVLVNEKSLIALCKQQVIVAASERYGNVACRMVSRPRR